MRRPPSSPSTFAEAMRSADGSMQSSRADVKRSSSILHVPPSEEPALTMYGFAAEMLGTRASRS
eukprot:jgi/Chrpa1/11678/Chrysochromulina_OHIO_Genome00013188-RA